MIECRCRTGGMLGNWVLVLVNVTICSFYDVLGCCYALHKVFWLGFSMLQCSCYGRCQGVVKWLLRPSEFVYRCKDLWGARVFWWLAGCSCAAAEAFCVFVSALLRSCLGGCQCKHAFAKMLYVIVSVNVRLLLCNWYSVLIGCYGRCYAVDNVFS